MTAITASVLVAARRHSRRIGLPPPYSLALLTFYILASLSFTMCDAYLCDPLSQDTWTGLSEAMESSFDGFVMLCPFEITGEGCPPEGVTGFNVQSWSNLYIMCEAFYVISVPREDDHSHTGCIIDCPGTHFAVQENSSLTLDSLTIRGSKHSAIKVDTKGSLNVFNSFFDDNQNSLGNGGAIHASHESQVYVAQSHFRRNKARSGGVLYSLGDAQIQDSVMTENEATGLGVDEGGGAIFVGEGSSMTLRDSYIAHNIAASFGPAILDLSGPETVASAANTGCNNTAQSLGMTCDGIFLEGDGVGVCELFETICEFPSVLPSEQTSSAPSTSLPISPTMEPSKVTSGPSDWSTFKPGSGLQPTQVPSYYPSMLPTEMHTMSTSDVVELLAQNSNEMPLEGAGSNTAGSNESQMQGAPFVVSTLMESIEENSQTMQPSEIITESTIAQLTSVPASSMTPAPPQSIPLATSATPSMSHLDPAKTLESDSSSIGQENLHTFPQSFPKDTSPSSLATTDSSVQGDSFTSSLSTDIPLFISVTEQGTDLSDSGYPNEIWSDSTSSPTFHVSEDLSTAPSHKPIQEMPETETLYEDQQLQEPILCPPLSRSETLSGEGSYVQGAFLDSSYPVSMLGTCGSVLEVGRKGAWFSFIGTGSIMTVHTCSIFQGVFHSDTQLSIYTTSVFRSSNCSDGLLCVDANDDYCGQQSSVSWYALENQMYFLYVHAKPTGSNGFLQGQFSLTLAATPGGSCDVSISIDPHPPSGEIQLNGNPDDIDLLGLNGGIWRRVNGTGEWIMVSTCVEGKGRLTRMKIFQGICGNLHRTSVAGSDCNTGHFVTWLSAPGETYYIFEYREDFAE